MVKGASIFVCQQCGNEFSKWMGKCTYCGEWNSLVETVSTRVKGKRREVKGRQESVKPILLTSVSSKSTKRISTKISELDRVLGGGLVSGQVVLIAGEPGIGKSTLLLQLADKLVPGRWSLDSRKKKKARDQSLETRVLYVSGEESVNQIKVRADRLGIRNKEVQIMEETDIDQIINQVSSINNSSTENTRQTKSTKSLSTKYQLPARKRYASNVAGGPATIIVDSIQTMATSDLSGMAGSVGQVKECAYRLVRMAKSKNIPVFIVGHVTKQGSIAGPSVLMHIVDTVLWFEGDKSLTLRMLRAVKNRFGPTDEVGVFSMEDKGLTSMGNPEKIFLSQGRKNVAGSVTTSTMQGTRPILIEIQSLVVPTKLAFPKRIAQGIDSKRFELLLAVLTRRCGMPLYEYDCFANVAGGINIKNDPSSDLAVCLSIASAYYDKVLLKKTVAIGEIGLLGDIREVVAQEKRVKEARRLGYRNVISSSEVKYLQEAIRRHLK